MALMLRERLAFCPCKADCALYFVGSAANCGLYLKLGAAAIKYFDVVPALHRCVTDILFTRSVRREAAAWVGEGHGRGFCRLCWGCWVSGKAHS